VSEPEFLDLDEVLALHEYQIAEFGGSRGIRDRALLESAVAMPRSTFVGEAMRTAAHRGRGLPSCAPRGRCGTSSHQRLQGTSFLRPGWSG